MLAAAEAMTAPSSSSSHRPPNSLIRNPSVPPSGRGRKVEETLGVAEAALGSNDSWSEAPDSSDGDWAKETQREGAYDLEGEWGIGFWGVFLVSSVKSLVHVCSCPWLWLKGRGEEMLLVSIQCLGFLFDSRRDTVTVAQSLLCLHVFWCGLT
jgi:hypothetical protein